MMRKRVVIITIVSIAVGILGALISWGLAENNYPSSLSKDDWLQFLGR